MYQTGQTYKIQMKVLSTDKKPIRYTAVILEEDALQIKIKDLFGEEVILNKSEMRQCKLVGQDKTGEASAQGT